MTLMQFLTQRQLWPCTKIASWTWRIFCKQALLMWMVRKCVRLRLAIQQAMQLFLSAIMVLRQLRLQAVQAELSQLPISKMQIVLKNSASIHQLISVVRCMVLALPSMHGMSIVMVGLGRMWVQTVSQKRIDLFQQIPSITTPWYWI